VPSTRAYLIVIALLLSLAVALQVWRDRGWQPYEPATPVLWLQDAATMRRLALGFDSLIADVYWMRAVVYFGRQRLSERQDKNYDLLYPFLDFVTTLDPRFTTAYRFGAIFLSEAAPGGPGRPDLAVTLLPGGAERTPERWADRPPGRRGPLPPPEDSPRWLPVRPPLSKGSVMADWTDSAMTPCRDLADAGWTNSSMTPCRDRASAVVFYGLSPGTLVDSGYTGSTSGWTLVRMESVCDG
jgi:hypothetical protein